MELKINSLFASLILLLGSLLFSWNATAQETNEIYRIYDESYSQQGTVLSKTASISVPEKLLNGNNPTLYVKNNSVLNQTGSYNPMVLKLEDVNSYGFLNYNNVLFKDVQVITINLKNQSDMLQVFDASEIKGFNKLKYIYVKCYFECSEIQIRNFVTNIDSEIVIFYKIVNPL